MSKDGTRPPTKAWSISPTGSTEISGSQVVAIEDAPAPDPASGPVAKGDEAVAPNEERRTRRGTVEAFNEELAILDRPLEGDVEYFDEPRPSRWRPAAGFVAVVAIVGLGGAILMSRHRAAEEVRAQVAAPAPSVAPVPAPAPEIAPAPETTQPVLAAQVPAAAAAPEALAAAPAADPAADDEAAADDAAADDGAEAAPVAPSAWSKVRASKTVQSSKHARSGGSKTIVRRVTKTRPTVVAKRTTSRRR